MSPGCCAAAASAPAVLLLIIIVLPPPTLPSVGLAASAIHPGTAPRRTFPPLPPAPSCTTTQPPTPACMPKDELMIVAYDLVATEKLICRSRK